jgi:hypothetical protein
MLPRSMYVSSSSPISVFSTRPHFPREALLRILLDNLKIIPAWIEIVSIEGYTLKKLIIDAFLWCSALMQFLPTQVMLYSALSRRGTNL